MQKIINKIKNNERGSITIFILVSMLFFITVLILSYSGQIYKMNSQKKQIEQIQEEYSAKDEIEEIYNQALDKISLSSIIKVGDYVAYDPTKTDKTNLTYQSPVGGYSSLEGKITHGNGDSEQTFTAKANNGTSAGLKWRVLSVSKDKVELISESALKTDLGNTFILKGGIGYLYAEQELNEICKIYGYGYGADTSVGATYTIGGPEDITGGKIEGTGARSITIDDLNKIAGIYEDIADGKMKYSDGTLVNSDYGNETNPSTAEYYPMLGSSNTTYPGQSTSKKTGIKYTFYSYNKEQVEDINIQSMLFNGNYWLASRCIVSTSNVNFDVHYVHSNGTNASFVCNGYTSGLDQRYYSSYEVRPVVTLKSNIIDISNVTENSGKAQNPWTLK